MWRYVQATGQMFAPDGREAGRGYAGRGASKNKPEDQCIPNEGPLPCNIYTIEPGITHPRLGPMAMPLTPHNASAMCGRTAFYVHGDSIANPGNASDGCIILDRALRDRINSSDDRELQVVARIDVAVASLGRAMEGGSAVASASSNLAEGTLRQLALPILLILAAAVLTAFVTAREMSPQIALFLSWALCAAAALSVVNATPAPLKNEVGRDDAAHMFTISWFVLLVSGMAAGSLWNVFVIAPSSNDFNAFVTVPPEVWILGGITILTNVGVRAAFAISPKPDKHNVRHTNNRIAELITTPLDDDGSAKMGAAQYVVFNLIALVVYGVAIARLFAAVTGTGTVPAFPGIPAEVLGLMAVSGAGLVATNAVPILRR